MDEINREKELSAIQHFFEMERYDEAVKHIELVLRSNPEDPAGHYYFAVVQFSKEQYEAARSYCENALKFGYDSETCYHLIGITYREQKKYKEAEKAYLRALETNPQSAEVHASYGYLMLLTGFDDKALNLLEEALNLDASSPTVNQYILKYYFAKSDVKKQQQYIQHLMEDASSEVQKLVNLAVFHELQDEVKEARELYRQAFLLDPKNKDLLAILEMIDESAHPIYLPHRAMNKIGGPGVVWVIVMAILFITYYMGHYVIVVGFLLLYILFCIYTWTASHLYRLFVKGRR
jgi:tetratricopeptide (TPR) repeat protein